MMLNYITERNFEMDDVLMSITVLPAKRVNYAGVALSGRGNSANGAQFFLSKSLTMHILLVSDCLWGIQFSL